MNISIKQTEVFMYNSNMQKGFAKKKGGKK